MCIEEIKVFASSIKKGPFKSLNEPGGHCRSEEIASRNEGDYVDIFECAVRQAYLDMCRTVKGAGTPPKQECVQEALGEASRCLRNYFAEKELDLGAFDKWMEDSLGKVSEAGKDAQITVGQSQKIINMALKYLYCCDDYRCDRSGYFTHCHMPLDDYTLTWYKHDCDPDWPKIPWSKIDDVDTYLAIQKNIREKLANKNVLVSEFEIWAGEKHARELAELKSAVEKIKDSDQCDLELREALSRFSEKLR